MPCGTYIDGHYCKLAEHSCTVPIVGCGVSYVYSKRKLNTDERECLNSPLQEAPIPEDLTDVVHVKKLRCHDRVETLYYSANFSNVICMYCSIDLPPGEHDQDNLPFVRNAKRSLKLPRNPRNNVCVQHTVCVYGIVCCV